MHTEGLYRDDLLEIMERGSDLDQSTMDQTLSLLNDKLWAEMQAKISEEEYLMSSEMRQTMKNIAQLYGQCDKCTLYVLLTQLEGRHEVSTFSEYLHNALTSSDKIESLQNMPLTTRFFDMEDLAKWNAIVEKRDLIREQPF